MEIKYITAAALQRIDDRIMLGLDDGSILAVTLVAPQDAPLVPKVAVRNSQEGTEWSVMHPGDEPRAEWEVWNTETVDLRTVNIDGKTPSVLVGFSKLLGKWFRRSIII